MSCQACPALNISSGSISTIMGLKTAAICKAATNNSPMVVSHQEETGCVGWCSDTGDYRLFEPVKPLVPECIGDAVLG